MPRSVAVKVLDEQMFGDAEARARFEREADLAARLDHPNIVTVYDRGVDGNRPWIAMQYVPGTDAATVGVLEPLRAVRIVSEVAEALDFAHSRGVLHRDVKPANVLLGATEQGRPERVLLADFGIARLHFDQNPLTQTGTFTATLAYASPEQLAGSAVGPQCDQYSLACTLFVLLTGAPPFAANNPVAVIQSHMSADPPAITLQRPDLPVGLDHMLRCAMASALRIGSGRVVNSPGQCGRRSSRSGPQPVSERRLQRDG
ncbi:serine/threonine-protein kinase [Nocardia ignorata]|nr:serine/threonine-protein kinase [Nocardia ignorata]